MTDMTLTCAELDVRLSDYLDGTLDAPSRAAVERHLDQCARCAGVLAALDDRDPAAAALPTLTPSRDLWSGIAARIESRILPLADRAVRPASRRSWRVARYAAAAAVLVASTAVVTYEVTTRTRGTSTVATTNPLPPQGTDPTRTLAGNPTLINTYDAQIRQLDSIVKFRRNDLDTTTVKVIEKNLRLIDAAIAESRAALAKDPRSRFLNDQLAHVLDQKVGLLRTVALLPSRT